MLTPLFRPQTARNSAQQATSPYTAGLIELLTLRFGLQPHHRGADLASLSPRLASLFLDHGFRISLVEPDPTRLDAHERLRRRWPHLTVVPRRPFATAMRDGSVDFIVTERALFHPAPEMLRQEFARILRPDGVVLMVTDNRLYGGGLQAEAFDDLLRSFCPQFQEKADPIDLHSSVANFFGDVQPYEDAFVGEQVLTLEAFLAQTSRLPIFPTAAECNPQEIFHALRSHFAEWSVGRRLHVPVVTRIACGQLGRPVQPLAAAPELLTAH